MSENTVPTNYENKAPQPAATTAVPQKDSTHSEVVVKRIQGSTARLSAVLDRLVYLRNEYFGPPPPTAVAEPGDPAAGGTSTFTDAFERASDDQAKVILAIESITDELQRIA